MLLSDLKRWTELIQLLISLPVACMAVLELAIEALIDLGRASRVRGALPLLGTAGASAVILGADLHALLASQVSGVFVTFTLVIIVGCAASFHRSGHNSCPHPSATYAALVIRTGRNERVLDELENR